MRRIELETWVLGIVDRVSEKQPVEDSRVELKSEWPVDHHKAARRLAGHCNAARGEPVLWIIGLDEGRGVVGASDKERTNWLAQIRSAFPEMYPDLLDDLNVPVDGKTLVALLFATDRAPYLVKLLSKSEVTAEIPWRDGTAVRTARREDLLRILTPLQRLPSIEVLKSRLSCQRDSDEPSYGERRIRWSLDVELYLVPLIEQRVVFPFHRCSACLKTEEGSKIVDLTHLVLDPPRSTIFMSVGRGTTHGGESLSATIASTRTEVIIDGPGVVELRGHVTEGFREAPELPRRLECQIALRPAGEDRGLSFNISLVGEGAEVWRPKGFAWLMQGTIDQSAKVETNGP